MLLGLNQPESMLQFHCNCFPPEGYGDVLLHDEKQQLSHIHLRSELA